MTKLVLYSKPGCHLCEGLAEKLAQVKAVAFELEIRDITQVEAWYQAYQYEIPVLCEVIEVNGELKQRTLPRLSPRASVQQLERMLQTQLGRDVL